MQTIMPVNINLIAIPLLLILGVATLMDWRERKIPNVLTFGAALFGLILHGTMNGLPGIGISVGGWVICLVAFLPLYAKGGMSAGDVKLMASVGAFVGPVLGITACLYTLIAGGLIGVASLASTWGLRSFAGFKPTSGRGFREALKVKFPYAGAVAAGTSIVLLVPAAVPTALLQFEF